MITVSAPAKIHLMGEHVVVYGKPAVLTAINRRLYVQIESVGTNRIEIDSDESDILIKEAIRIIKKTYHVKKLPGMRLMVTSDIPVGSGLGSSASLAVATIGALHLFLKKGWNPQTINKLAYKIEKKQHGLPSGGDNTIVTFGGFLWFRKEFEFLKSIWQLPFRLPPRLTNKFILIDSGRANETTKQMVENVKSKVKSQKSKIERIFSNQEELTKRMVLALKAGDEKEIMEVIRKGERNLEKLGLVGKKAATMISIIMAKDGVAKISGAGGIKEGSGMLLCFHQHPQLLVELARKNKWQMMQVELGEEGVRREATG